MTTFKFTTIILTIGILSASRATCADEAVRIYENMLRPMDNPQPILADYPQYVQPVWEERHFEAPPLVVDDRADLDVRAWRYSYHVRGIVEIPNRLAGNKCALIVVHPWGIDDGQGWCSPEPAGTAFGCTPQKNRLIWQHAREVVRPLVERLRPHVRVVVYSLPGEADRIRSRLYRTLQHAPSDEERAAARRELESVLRAFSYRAGDVPAQLTLRRPHVTKDYFEQFPGLRPDDHYNGDGFWRLPIPVSLALEVAKEDVVVFDAQGYSALRKFLQEQGVEHVLLCGYATDMCVRSTTAGYQNLRQDFNVFLVADATQATFPAARDARFATNQAVAFASLELLITQVNWVKFKKD